MISNLIPYEQFLSLYGLFYDTLISSNGGKWRNEEYFLWINWVKNDLFFPFPSPHFLPVYNHKISTEQEPFFPTYSQMQSQC